MISININQASEIIAKVLLSVKKEGVLKAHFIWDINTNEPSVFDTDELYRHNVAMHKELGINHYKSIPVGDMILRRMKVASAVILVFRDEDPNVFLTNCLNQKGEYVFDLFGLAFGYAPANCEFTIVEVTF